MRGTVSIITRTEEQLPVGSIKLPIWWPLEQQFTDRNVQNGLSNDFQWSDNDTHIWYSDNVQLDTAFWVCNTGATGNTYGRSVSKSNANYEQIGIKFQWILFGGIQSYSVVVILMCALAVNKDLFGCRLFFEWYNEHLPHQRREYYSRSEFRNGAI
jgi:hypothetical protein